MSIALNSNISSQVVAGLGTFTYTIKTAGDHLISCQSSILPGSGLSIVLKQNSTTLLTVASPNPLQVASNAQVLVNLSANDVVSIVLTSSTAIDQPPNVIKSIITMDRQS